MNVIANVWGTLEQEKRATDFCKVDPMRKFIISKMKKKQLWQLGGTLTQCHYDCRK